MKDVCIDMEDDQTITVSTWDMTVSLLKMTIR